jgi:hypothetical protein
VVWLEILILIPLLGEEYLLQSFTIKYDLYFFFRWSWSLNSGLCACQVGTLPLELHGSWLYSPGLELKILLPQPREGYPFLIE